MKRSSRKSDAKGPRLSTGLRELHRLGRAELAHADLKEHLGAHILQHVLKWLEIEGRRRPRDVAVLFGLPGDQPLAELCEEIIAWGCAFPEVVS